MTPDYQRASTKAAMPPQLTAPRSQISGPIWTVMKNRRNNVKRLLCVLLFIVLLPSLSFSELSKYDLKGIWTCYIYENDLHLYQMIFDDYNCYYCLYDHFFDGSGYVLSPLSLKECYFVFDGSDVFFKEYQTSTDVLFSGRWSGGFLYVSFDGDTWYKFTRSAYQYDAFTSDTVPSSFSSEVYQKLDAGFSIPSGIYTVGIDFPSGDYTLTADSSLNVIVKANRMSTKEPTSFSMSPGSTFGKITLDDGNLFSFSNGNIILKTYKGLFD